MLLYYYTGFDHVRNFGDDLNPYIWDRYLPGVFDEKAAEVFVGIGTLLNERIPDSAKVIIMGSGVGYGKLPDKSITDTWEIYCLRGKLSAEKLGVSINLVASDPAILVHRIIAGSQPKRFKYAFMPNWENMGSAWKDICDSLNFRLLDPLDSVENIIRGISESEIVITEAMHGAIVSDALRTPWVAVHSSFGDYLPFKWLDWCSSLSLEYRSESIGRLWHPEDIGMLTGPKRFIKSSLRSMRNLTIEKRLKSIARKMYPQMSTDRNLHIAIDRLEAAIEKFKRRQDQ